MDITFIILLIIIFILLKGFFAGSEIAMVNVDKLKLHHLARTGHHGARHAIEMISEPSTMLSTTLVGTNIATVVTTTLGTSLMVYWLGDHGELFAFLLLTPLLLILGEVVPKSVFQQKSDQLVPWIIRPLRWAAILFYPINAVFSFIARLVARLVGGKNVRKNLFLTREQLRSVLEMAEHASDVDVFDRGRIKKVIRFADTLVGEAMNPIAEVTSFDVKRDISELVTLVRRRGYNPLPVYEGNTNNIIGVVSITPWDSLEQTIHTASISELIALPLYVSPLQTIDQILPILRDREDHMAIVVDEFGSAIGVITMEDILEEVVGDIQVGYDFEEHTSRQRRIYEMLDEDVFLMDARLPISEVNELLGITLPSLEFHTVGGFVSSRLRHIPKEGESVTEAGYRFTVERATHRNIIKLRIEPYAHTEAR